MGRKEMCIYMWRGRTENGRLEDRGKGEGKWRNSFIAKTLLKTLKKLPPLQAPDVVRRIPFLL
jgi:hypothetical protein